MSSVPAYESTLSYNASLPDRNRRNFENEITLRGSETRVFSAQQWDCGRVSESIAWAWVIIACKITIGFVATYDVYLTLKYASFLDRYEQNPVGRWLMSLDKGPVNDLQQIAAFVTAKFAGTLLVLIILQVIAGWRIRLGVLVAVPIALIQLYLAYYLTFWTFERN